MKREFHIDILRFCESERMGTFGEMQISDVNDLFYTVENPWIRNRRRVSSIPDGTYPFVPGFFNHGGYKCYDVLLVPGRGLIKMHVANQMQNVDGCFGPGLDLGGWERKDKKFYWSVTESQAAFDRIMGILDSRSGTITFRSR